MGKRSAVVELFLGDMGSMQRELRPSTQREDQLTMETKLEQIAVKAANQLPKSVVREIRTPRSVGTGGGRPPLVTRWSAVALARMGPPRSACRVNWPGGAGCLAVASLNSAVNTVALSLSATHQPTILRLKISMMT